MALPSLFGYFPVGHWGFPDTSVGKESACNAGDLARSLGWEDPLEKGKATHSSILAWRIPWTIHGVIKSKTRLSHLHFLLDICSIDYLQYYDIMNNTTTTIIAHALSVHMSECPSGAEAKK